jgi:hypothetical protein
MLCNIYCRFESEHADVLQQQAIIPEATIHHRKTAISGTTGKALEHYLIIHTSIQKCDKCEAI